MPRIFTQRAVLVNTTLSLDGSEGVTIPLGLSLVVLRELIVVDIVRDVLAEHHDGGPLPIVCAFGDLDLLNVETVEEVNEEIKIHLLGPGSGQTSICLSGLCDDVCIEEDVDTEGPGRTRYLKYDSSQLRSSPRSAASNLSGQSDQTFYFASVQITNTEIQEIRSLVNHPPLLPD